MVFISRHFSNFQRLEPQYDAYPNIRYAKTILHHPSYHHWLVVEVERVLVLAQVLVPALEMVLARALVTARASVPASVPELVPALVTVRCKNLKRQTTSLLSCDVV